MSTSSIKKIKSTCEGKEIKQYLEYLKILKREILEKDAENNKVIKPEYFYNHSFLKRTGDKKIAGDAIAEFLIKDNFNLFNESIIISKRESYKIAEHHGRL